MYLAFTIRRGYLLYGHTEAASLDIIFIVYTIDIIFIIGCFNVSIR